MATPPALPTGKPVKPTIMRETDFDLSEFLQEYSKGLINNFSGIRIFIDDFELLKSNIHIIDEINKKNPYMRLTSYDYSALEYIDNHLSSPGSFKLQLLDDFKMIDRSYIYPSNFKNSKFEIPMTYVQWCNNIKNDILISKNNVITKKDAIFNPHFQVMNVEFLKYVRELAYNLSKNMDGLTDVDKNLLIADYLQNICQYVEGIESHARTGIYEIDLEGKELTGEPHRPDTVLKEHYGVCVGIAAAETLLLNNPFVKVDAKSIASMDHEYNAVKIGNKYYYDDNTWNITRSKEQYEESLKAKSISTDYSLFGKNKALEIGHHKDEIYAPEMELEDLPREEIQEGLYKIKHIAKLTDYEKPVFKSKLRK